MSGYQKRATKHCMLSPLCCVIKHQTMIVRWNARSLGLIAFPYMVFLARFTLL